MSLEQAAAFIQDTLTNTQVGLAWGTAVSSGDPIAMQSFVTNSGYDCTVTEVWQASEMMAAYDLTFWIGSYGNTYVWSGATRAPGQTLVVQDNTTVTYDGQALTGMNYTNSVLSWTGGGNGTSGTVQFKLISGITDKPLPPNTYTGNEFTGTITIGSGTAQPITGRIGASPIPSPNPPPPPGPSNIDQMQKYINYILEAFGIAVLIASGYKCSLYLMAKFTADAPAAPVAPAADPVQAPAGDPPAAPNAPADPPPAGGYPPDAPPGPPAPPAPPGPPAPPEPPPPPEPPIDPPAPPAPGCFLTTAVVNALGLDDDSEPLALARHLRDHEMTGSRDRSAIDLYYKIAPVIVARSTNANWILFWQQHMKVITILIKYEHYELAKDLYTFATARLVDQKATRYADHNLVEEVYAYGLKGFARIRLPYPIKYIILKMALKAGLAYQGIRLWFAKRHLSRLTEF